MKTKKIELSVTGFEPAISRFVAERVIRCATRMSDKFSEWLNLNLLLYNLMNSRDFKQQSYAMQ